MSTKSAAIALLALCEVAAMAVWFSAAAIAPGLVADFGLSAGGAGWLTSLVQLGFVVGALGIAVTGLADRVDPRALFSVGALTAALANLTLLIAPPETIAALTSRFVVGACMAGVYPIGLKIAAGWARPGDAGRRGDLGLLAGILVGALALGSAAPHLAQAIGGAPWRPTLLATSALSAAAGLAIWLTPLGPIGKPAATFRAADALALWREPALRLVNLGYLGHMWEIYAAWAWLAVFVEASYRLSGGGLFGIEDAAVASRVTTFVSIGIAGGLSCVLAGAIADRIGRTRLTSGAMVISGACALGSAAVFGAAPELVFALCFLWGFTIVADSAQFSAAAAELAPPDRVGTILTAQTCGGFLLTIVTIQAAPIWAEAIGWRYAFAPLALGPIVGVIAMLRLRARPEAARLAGGRG